MNGDSGSNPHVGKYLGIYFAFGIGSSALVVVQTLILWIFCSIEVSTPVILARARLAPSRSTPISDRICLRAGLCYYAIAGANVLLGIEKVTRENGFCHLQEPNEFL